MTAASERRLGALLREVAPAIAAQARANGVSSLEIYLVGGAAMASQGFDRKVSDLDMFASHPVVEECAPVISDALSAYGIECDATSDRNIWSDTCFADLEGHALPLSLIEVDGVSVGFNTVDVETLIVQKIQAGRDKDLFDVNALMAGTSLDRLADRLNSLAQHNAQDHIAYLASSVLSEWQLCHLDEDPEASAQGFIASLSLDETRKGELCRSYGIDVMAVPAVRGDSLMEGGIHG